MTLAFVVPGLDEAASEKAIAILQNRLSQEQEAALVLKHAHWNVTGPNFIAVHEMLDPEVEAVLAQADETAERIATLGGTPDGRADAITRNRTWKPFDVDGRAGTEKYLEALIEYYDAFIADDRKAIAELDELDVISSNIIQDHVQELEKFQTQKMHINDGDGSVAMLSRRHHLFCCRDMSAACFTICFTAVRAC